MATTGTLKPLLHSHFPYKAIECLTEFVVIKSTNKKWTGLGVRLAHCKGLGIKMWKLFRGMGNYM